MCCLGWFEMCCCGVIVVCLSGAVLFVGVCVGWYVALLVLFGVCVLSCCCAVFSRL